MEIKLCAAPGCENEFEAYPSNKKYCSITCKNRARYQAEEENNQLESFGAYHSISNEESQLTERLEFLRKENDRLQRAYEKRHIALDETFDVISQTIAQNVRQIKVSPNRTTKNSPKAPELVLNPVNADLQIGKVTESYNSDVARHRIALYTDKIIERHKEMSSDFSVNQANVWFLGDIVEGENIFPAQPFLIDTSVFRQATIDAPEIYGEQIVRLLEVVDKVKVTAVIGNHGRLSKFNNPESNMDRVFYQTLYWMFHKEPRVEFVIPQGHGESSFWAVDKIGNYSTLLVHGDQFGPPTTQTSYVKKILSWHAGGIPVHFDAVMCFVEGTLINTIDGLKPIEEIQVGDLVQTHEGNWKPVVDTQSRLAETVTLKGQGHPGIQTTLDHPFYGKRLKYNSDNTWAELEGTEWIEAKDMPGNLWSSPTSFPFVEIDPFEYVSTRENRFEITPELMRFAGRWLGDGWVGEYGKDSVTYLCGHPDEEHELKEILTSAGLSFFNSTPQEFATVRFNINGSALVRWLVRNFGKGAHNKTIPAWAFSMPIEYRKAMLEGLIGSDGHYPSQENGNKWEYCSASKKLAIGVKLLAQSLNITTYLYYDEREKMVEIGGRKAHQRNRWIVKGRTKFVRWGESIQVDDCLLTKVREAKPSGQAKVYNMTVADDSSYVADGLIVHNCGHYHQNVKFTIGDIVVRISGSPESTNTFAQERLGVMGRPSQHLQFIDPNSGVYWENDIYLD